MKRISIGIIFILLLALAALPALAATPGHEAGAVIHQAVEQVLQRLNNPAIKQAGPEQNRLLKEIQDIIYSRIDFEEFSARTIGARWRDFTPEQRRNFQQAISDLLYYTYFKSLLQYQGEPIEYVGEMVSSKGDKVEVKTNFIYEGKPIPVNYRMLRKGKDWLVYDMFIESISMVQNYRGQFQQVLQKENPDQLIKMINAKAQEQKANANATLASPKI